MPKSKKDAIEKAEKGEGSQPLTEAEFHGYVEKYWKPHFGELMLKQMEFALSDNKGADAVREKIIDRLAGKPVERQLVEQKQAITINISRYEPSQEGSEASLGPNNSQSVVLSGEIGSLTNDDFVGKLLGLPEPSSESFEEAEYRELPLDSSGIKEFPVEDDLDGEIHL